MSQKDLNRVRVLERRKAGELTQTEGAAALQVSVRQAIEGIGRSRAQQGGIQNHKHKREGKERFRSYCGNNCRMRD